jgi:hypothetical protein
VVLPQKLFEDKVLCDNYEQRYGLFFPTQPQDVSPVPACEDVGSVCFDKRCVLSIFAHSIGLRVWRRAYLDFDLILFFFCGYVCFF